MRLAVVAEQPLLDLAGLSGEFPWGTASADVSASVREADAVIALGTATVPAEIAVPVLRWHGEAEPTLAGRDGRPWRRGPWPANDELFSLAGAPPADEQQRETRPVLIAGGGGDRNAKELAWRLRAGGLSVTVGTLSRDRLAAAAVVVLLSEPYAALSPAAPAVLAAGRVLVTARAEPAYGLLPGIDHLAYVHDTEVPQLAASAATYFTAYESVRTMATLAAEAHRASSVYGRLAIDLGLFAASA